MLLAAASALPVALMGVILWRMGVIDKFWFWTFQYAREYATATPLSAGLKMLVQSIRYITLANWAVWLAATVGLFLLWRGKNWLLLAFLALSFLAVCPGFYFRDHYFILLLPAVALCVGAAAMPGWPLWAVTAVILFSTFEQRAFLLETDPVQVTASVYGANPFPEAVEIAKYIRANSLETDKIAVLGSEPEIYFYSGRQSATPFIYAYPLMESHPFARGMQEEFVRDFRAAKPAYVVLVNVETSWLRTAASPDVLLKWWETEGAKEYRQVGVADIFPEGTE